MRRLAAVAEDDEAPAMVLVTHHVEEIPSGFTHVLLLREESGDAGTSRLRPDQRCTVRMLRPALLLDRFGSRWAARAAP